MQEPKRRGGKAPKTETTQGNDTVRLNYRLNADLYKRLLIHSAMAGKSPGDMLADAISAHCRRWAMPADLSARVSDVHDRVNLDAEVRITEPVAA